ncbi:hypothetical protein JOS77_13670 [Chromobacterium haemolyticum]|nr:hypothetical protein JOS77_13670 [Chromobacterium haemolyticum]
MSYLQFPRLAFSGQFQSDVSTVNNDPRHYDTTPPSSRVSRNTNKRERTGAPKPITAGGTPPAPPSCASPTAK